MRKLAVSLLVVGLAVLLAPLTPVDSAAATPPAQATRSWLRLSLASIQPGVVRSNDTSVTLMGRITNISDRHIGRITARLQLAGPLTSAAGVRSALSPTASYDHSDTAFAPVTDSLAPGQSVDFSVSEPLRGPHSLQVSQPGVYPLMVNVQGVPDYSTAYRLVVGTMLLPVLAPSGGQQPHPGPAGDLTVLWPLVDRQPRVVGSAGDKLVLSDDTLATSLAPGGRLFGLLDAVQQAAGNAPALLTSLCFVVDPDLLDTVRAMSGGYLVRGGPHGTTEGRGAEAAALWLSTLKNLTTGHCALVLPYADADLAALVHGGGSNLAQLALSESTTVAQELGTTPMAEVAWPEDNTLDTATMAAMAGFGVSTVLLSPDSITPRATGGPVALAGFTGGAAPKVVPIDPVVAGAMAPRTDEPDVDETGISVQDGLAATIYQTVFGGGAGRPVLIAPPRRWSPTVSQAEQFLSGAASVLAGHYATPATLSDAVRATPTGRPATLRYPPATALAEVSHRVTVGAVATDAAERDVAGAMGRDHTTPRPVLPGQLITPLQLGLLRSVSGAWRGGGSGGADAMLTSARAQFQDLLQNVSVVQPTLPILLGSEQSRLPVTVNNRLPVDIAVRVDLSGEPGLPSTGVDDLIPAHSGITVFIPTTVTRSGRFSAYATVRTLGGTQLGSQARLELVSSAYGTIIVIVTAIAFGLLVLLSGRRIYRRVRASHAATAQEQPGQEAVGALVGGGEPADRSEHREPDQR
jgi:hypothetical protein